MPERLKEILQKVIDWWNKFTARQKTIIIGLGATIIFALAIVIYVTQQPKYVDLRECETAAEAAEVKTLLEAAQIKYQPSADGLKFRVEASQYPTAVWTLGSSGVGADGYTIQEALNGSISTTASDKEKLTLEAYQSRISKVLTNNLSNVKSAEVLLNIPPQDGTLSRTKQESSAYIQLELTDDFPVGGAANIARAVATWLGNETTANITILDSNSNLLYTGGDEYEAAGIANSMQELQNQGQAMVANQVKTAFYGTHQFDNVEVVGSLDMDYSNYENTVKQYRSQFDGEQALLAHREIYSQTNENTASSYGPGTDSNDETVYVSPDGSNSSSEQSEELDDYLPDEEIMHKLTPAGVINYDNSRMSISLIRYHDYRQEELEAQGLLDGITWAEFKANNAQDVRIEVEDAYYEMAQNATRIPRDNITIIAYETPRFIAKPGLELDWTNVASIVMLIVILALLALVVLRSMSSKKKAAEDEELSVEDLLQSTQELEDIDVEAKSETRKLIEKFVDENPEAAAALLRNWLDEDW
ncbi:MAG: flagellar M-ring protein FliF [Butyrivibrio sp.]|nr:flagellar M-ring protein FliF [Muribaculum sp.]MCM1552697.1 flagellar M-ring protein FliF [Butyrivibrio sp.]